jgi:Fe-S-cluster containining protein
MGGGVTVARDESKQMRTDAIVQVGKVIMLKSIGGRCSQLKAGACECYSVRPKGCAEYPWYNINGMLYYDSGCPGILFDERSHPKASELMPIDRYLVGPSWLKKIIVRLLQAW